MSEPSTDRDDAYLQILLRAVAVSASYMPRLGQSPSRGIDLEGFKRLYGQDPFYSWFGLNDSIMYAAHRAAGGMTSIYRQIGSGCEQLFRQILKDTFQLTTDQVKWTYVVDTSSGGTRTLALDARLDMEHLADDEQRRRLRSWVSDAASFLSLDNAIAEALKGSVFEVRQGYKSKGLQASERRLG